MVSRLLFGRERQSFAETLVFSADQLGDDLTTSEAVLLVASLGVLDSIGVTRALKVPVSPGCHTTQIAGRSLKSPPAGVAPNLLPRTGGRVSIVRSSSLTCARCRRIGQSHRFRLG